MYGYRIAVDGWLRASQKDVDLLVNALQLYADQHGIDGLAVSVFELDTEQHYAESMAQVSGELGVEACIAGFPQIRTDERSVLITSKAS